MANIAVIGAGVVGLSTAVNLLESFPRAKVTVIADRFNGDTTSDGAAGIFLPELLPGVSPFISRKWMRDSWTHFWNLSLSAEGPLAGVCRISGYQFGHKREVPDFKDIVLECNEMSDDELASIDDGHYRYGVNVTTVIVQCRRYLPWLMKRFISRRGKVKKEYVKTLSQLAGAYDVVVDCSGIGSRTLFSDDHIYPVRGQVIRVLAPWVKHFYRLQGGPSMYIHPDMDTVVLGGTAQKHDVNTELDASDRADIWRKCCQVLPGLKKAPVEREWVGLRPARYSFRLEYEEIQLPNACLKVVHNVGHGGNGVSYSWGTAKATVALVRQAIAALSSKL